MGAPRIERLDLNGILNGGMDSWFRFYQTTPTVTVNTATGIAQSYVADRMGYGTAGSTVKNFTIARSTQVPTRAQVGELLNYSLQFSCVTAITSPAATDVVLPIRYRMEGRDYAKYHGKTSTFGFWIFVTSSASFPIQVPVAFGNTSRSYVTTVQVNANSTWQFCTVTVPFESSGSYSFDNSLGIQITIGAGAVGSNYLATPNTWSSGDLYGVSGAFNVMGVNTNIMRVTGIGMVEGVGDLSGNFVRQGRTIQGEEYLLQRYFRLITGTGGVAVSTTTADQSVAFFPEMRAAPTMGFTGALQITDQTTTDFNQSSGNISQVSVKATGGRFRIANFTGLTTGKYYSLEPDNGGGTWATADAEL